MYEDFAYFYDRLTADADYKARTDYLISLFEKFDRKPSLLLDLCCGTGNFSREFADRGISVIGVDISPDMLSVARENSCGRDILYLCQNACELDLYGTVDGAVCCLDSLNHITDYGDFCRAIECVSLFLEKDRLFIFDVNTVYKHEKVLGNNVFIIDEDDIYCVWSNSYDPDGRTTEISLDFFVPCDDGRYERTFDSLTERAYTTDEIEKALCMAGLEKIAVYKENTQQSPDEDTERLVFIAKKR